MTIEAIGQGLKQKRLELGLSQKDAAARIGYCCSSLRNMEQGNKNVLFRRYVTYANALGLKIICGVVE